MSSLQLDGVIWVVPQPFTCSWKLCVRCFSDSSQNLSHTNLTLDEIIIAVWKTTDISLTGYRVHFVKCINGVIQTGESIISSIPFEITFISTLRAFPSLYIFTCNIFIQWNAWQLACNSVAYPMKSKRYNYWLRVSGWKYLLLVGIVEVWIQIKFAAFISVNIALIAQYLTPIWIKDGQTNEKQFSFIIQYSCCAKSVDKICEISTRYE